MKFAALAVLCSTACLGTGDVFAAGKVDFNRDIRPLLSERCFQCHGPDAKQRKADLRLDTRDGLFGKRDGTAAVVPKNHKASELLARITSKDPDLRMPPVGKPLTAQQIALIKRWIEEGADWQGHWAYLSVRKPAVPTQKNPAFVRNDIDRFLLRQLQKRGMKPSGEATRRVLIRRLKFDLIGLPPTPDEVAAFIADKRPDAYERLVDRYLASKHYGERMAMNWLDAVRFADTNGIHGDNHRDVWLFRDYVLKSFNTNKPFNQFTIEQLAGDLLPEATTEQRVASGYNRLLMTTREGGAQAKEYRAKYAADRVRNVSIAWLGSTMGCSECHDHKYDPFTMKDFYSMAAFFADIRETAVGAQPPNLVVPTAEQQAESQRIDAQIAALQKQQAALVPELARKRREWEAAMRKQILAGNANWSILTPQRALSSGRSRLVTQKDGSVLSTGRNPAKDSYTVTLKTDHRNITAIRLEALTHPSLKNGLSRDNGNFVLTRFEVLAGKTPVKLARATADYSQPQFPVANAIDGKPSTGWAVAGHQRKGQNRTAVFQFAKPLAGGPGTTLTIRLRHESRFPRHNIGRFRLSLTSSPKPTLKGGLPGNVVAALKVAPNKRNAAQKDALRKYHQSVAPELQKIRSATAALQKKNKQLAARAPTTLIAEAMAKPRMVRILPRGNWLDDSGTVVRPSTPSFLRARVFKRRQTRLDLAKWITSESNPLTARVFVNRLWKQFFGRGIVSSTDDFGAQGTWPTHPELLDWLASDFVSHRWDVKRAVKQIVMSGAYRQTSYADAKLRRLDPYNNWFARQGRFRLDAELVRDNALAVSGLLVPKLGGRSVKPYQPIGYWAHLNFPRRTYKHDSGEGQYRRGLYSYWCRTFLHPSLLAFDAPSREECTVARPRSNTPLQALVLLNDPTYVEAARTLAERVVLKGGKSPAERLKFAYATVLQREPRPEESKLLLALLNKHRSDYRKDPKAAADLLTVGLKPASKDIPADELAAWTSITRVLLNLHETITRY